MRVAYVLPVPPTDDGPAARAATWPHDQRLLRLLADRHGIDAHAVWPATASAPSGAVGIDGVTHHVTTSIGRTVRRLRPDVVHLNGLVFARLALTLRVAAGRRALLVAQHHGELVPAGGRRAALALRLQAVAVDRFLFCGLPGQAAPWRAAGALGRRARTSEVLEASTDLRVAGDLTATTGADRRAAAAGPAPGGDPDVLWVGRWSAGKDATTALDGFARFAARRPGARLWLAGPEVGPGAPAPPVPLPAGATLLGRLPAAELARWYATCPLLLSASRHEGSGYAVIEALANGCLPVLSDLPSHRAIAGPAAELFPVGDAAALAAALDRAAERAAAPGARAAVRARFDTALTWEHAADQLAAAYRA